MKKPLILVTAATGFVGRANAVTLNTLKDRSVNEPLKSRWTRICRVINSLLLAMDPDPWEYMHSRMRRLEEAVYARESAATPTPQLDLQRRIVLRRALRRRNLDERLSS